MTVVFQSTTPDNITFAGSSIYRVMFGGFIGQDLATWLRERPGYDPDNLDNIFLNGNFEWVEALKS